jgi:hypothetical protein
MLSFAAERPARTQNPPLHTFALAEGTAAVFPRAVDVDPSLWAETFGDQPKDVSYYKLLERTMSEGFVYRYLVLAAPDGTLFALQPLLIVDQDLSISLGKQVAAPLLRVLRRLFPAVASFPDDDGRLPGRRWAFWSRGEL